MWTEKIVLKLFGMHVILLQKLKVYHTYTEYTNKIYINKGLVTKYISI